MIYFYLLLALSVMVYVWPKAIRFQLRRQRDARTKQHPARSALPLITPAE